MTLNEVIETIRTWIKTTDDEYDIEEQGKVYGMMDCLELIKQIEPEQKWIPVSDGMPKETNYYLIQHTRRICNDKMAVAFYSVEEAHVDPNYTWEFVTNSDVQEVIAWMPLPALYEPQESEEVYAESIN